MNYTGRLEPPICRYIARGRPTPPRSDEEKPTRTPIGKERVFTAVEEKNSVVDLEYPDGGWRAWGVVVGTSWFLPVVPIRD